ncbi:MAG: pyruvate:ferredoxin (flavodoxin) oxidoreductase [Oscillospiraceae bacterium]|jgi:pyruvate-ferredoxin/flavodoxin oxidoreductase
MQRKLKTMDGNTAAAHVSYAFTEVAAIYPITPSSVMAELTDKWSAEGRKNIFGQPVRVAEMQSEAGAAGAVHGSLAVGALTTTYTASQGLLLMIPNMYKIAGEHMPNVIHCSARALSSQALSIFGDQSDVMACRQTGYAMLASTNPQEVMDLGAVAHMAALRASMPFLHFFDGFRTSHEMQKIEVWDYDELKEMLDRDAVAAFRARALNPTHPTLRGSNQNPDVFFQFREASNSFYDAIPEIVEDCMAEVNRRIGTDYRLFNYYGAPDADRVIIIMGSAADTCEEVVDYLNERGEKTGVLKVRLYRPFAADRLLKELPASVKKIAVMDRTKEPGALGEPMYLDVVAALRKTEFDDVTVVGGRYGLSSKDTGPGCFVATFENLKKDKPLHGFTVGIEDDVTKLSLPITENPDVTAKGTVSCKFWGIGSDGTVGANKNSIKIIGDYTDKKVQAYFQYDSKKSGGVTISHIRFGDKPIKSSYYITAADFVACHKPSYIESFDIVQDVKPGGVFLLNCEWDDNELSAHLPAAAKEYIKKNNIRFYTCNAVQIAKDLGLGSRTNMILQAAFFKLADIIPIDEAVKHMKEAVQSTYGRKGKDVVDQNLAAIDAGLNALHEVNIAALTDEVNAAPGVPDTEGVEPGLAEFVNEILVPCGLQKGDKLPVSKFVSYSDGTLPQGTAAFEKRGIAIDVPDWIPENCIQCNQCSLVCPHAVIRPVAVDAAEERKAPENMKLVKLNGKQADLKFSLLISPLDCTGCGSCAQVCPAKNKALKMIPLADAMEQQKVFNWGVKSISEKDTGFAASTVKGSQFKKPYLEFSGACAGCGESPYAKLITQLFGRRMIIANATGCTSIWGGSAPSTPYTVDKDGRGVAWASSLFEDNAEYGYGMHIANTHRRESLRALGEKIAADKEIPESVRGATAKWLEAFNDADACEAIYEELKSVLAAAIGRENNDGAKKLMKEFYDGRDLFIKPSQWIFGGDGWAYDIGYGGLDHVLASRENVNIFVFDTEVYSNTGGQASKASQTGQVAQFAAAGKATKKKDLAAMAMSYGYVYVAQVALGADYQQTLKALIEAESYDGPSLIIGYAPCINHGIKIGMNNAMLETKRAVQAGYWHMFRYDPRLEAQGKNPFQLDSKAPTGDYREFLMGEVRYNSLGMAFPERAEKLFEAAVSEAAEKYRKLAQQAGK